MAHQIEIMGLGAGDLDQLPFGIYKRLIHSPHPIWVRTKDHSVVAQLEREDVRFESFDSYYEREEPFEDTYGRIVETLIKKAKENDVIYAVPGHPMLAERTVQLLLKQDEVSVEVTGGQSYLDDLFTTLKMDPIDGFQFVDGTSFKRSQLQYQQHLIFCQVYDRYIASEVKLALLEDLPGDYLVTIVEAAGSRHETLTEIPLKELDHSIEVTNLTSVYVPPVPEDMLHHTFSRLREVIATLRGPDGCEWNRAQTHESLRTYLIEEVYELVDAIDKQDDEGIIEELGDVLQKIMLHSQIGEDMGYFTVDDVIRGITEKMIYRHPHVFHNSNGDVAKNWEELKQAEKGEHHPSILDDMPKGLSSLVKAYILQRKDNKQGFDKKEVRLKLEEGMNRFQEAKKDQNVSEMEKELGNVLFTLVHLARHYQINPELALNRANQSFLLKKS